LILAGFAGWAISSILGRMRDNDWTRVLGWPGYKVYRHEIDEAGKRLKLWVRRRRANKLWSVQGAAN
jgi:hypothetical protein